MKWNFLYFECFFSIKKSKLRSLCSCNQVSTDSNTHHDSKSHTNEVKGYDFFEWSVNHCIPGVDFLNGLCFHDYTIL